MGCDIHLYSESKKNGKWVADKETTFDPMTDAELEDGVLVDGYPSMHESYSGSRNYWLFGLLACGVRTDWDYSFPINGISSDTSPEIAACFSNWGEDAHSASHLTRKQLQNKCAELLLVTDPDARANLGYLSALIAELPECDDPENQRIVFWFDN